MNGVEHLYKKSEKVGAAEITKFIFKNDKNPLFNLRQMRDSGSMFTMVDGTYVRLHVDGQLMMSDTRMERISNTEFVKEARGDVLIAGLGIGLVLQAILDEPSVKSVTVVEKSADVIALVAKRFNHSKLSVINADVFEWSTERKFHVIYFDIWAEINTMNLPQMKTLHKRYRKNLLKGGWMNSWMREWLQKRRRAELKEVSEIEDVMRMLGGRV